MIAIVTSQASKTASDSARATRRGTGRTSVTLEFSHDASDRGRGPSQGAPLERVAIDARDGTFTYKDFDRAVSAVASRLGPSLSEDRVALFAHPGFAFAATLYGIWRAGGVAVPLAVSHPPAELEYVVRDSGASIVVADAAALPVLRPIAAAIRARLVPTTDVLGVPSGNHSSLLPPGSQTLTGKRALILYTSGTTGTPKGVVTTHRNIAAQIESLISAWEWTAADRALLVLPLHHVHGLINLLGCALASGATCEIHPQFDAERTWDRLAAGDTTVFSAVPTVYHRLIASWETAAPALQRARTKGCRAVRLMMSGSAPLPVRTLDRWREITGHTLLERYGMTEIGMALSNPLHGERRPGFVGAPLPGVTVRLVDDEGRRVGEGIPGELEVRGPGVFLEYWRRPDETHRAFREGWFRTGDVAVCEGGAYRLLGRTNVDILKTGGFKVSALEIEEVLRSHPAVADCAVVGIPDVEWGERVCAAVECRAGQTVAADDLRNWARARLAPYKVPKQIQLVETLPRNAMGKVVKSEVLKLLA